jgi:hypothetical protein
MENKFKNEIIPARVGCPGAVDNKQHHSALWFIQKIGGSFPLP